MPLQVYGYHAVGADNRRKIMQRATRAFCLAVVCVIAITIAIAYTNKASSANAALPAQDVMSLDRRISAFEQRLYIMESHINQLQQQVQYAQRQQPATSNTRDPEVERLRLELNLLQSRLGEVECALLKLDERTLPAAARTAPSKTTDPCRLQPNTPVQLSSRRQ
jgi:peptidoglycan hydrolase CwlO-like protein